MNTKMITKIGLLAVVVCITLVFAVGCKKKDQGSATEEAVSSADSTTSSVIKDTNEIKDSNVIKEPNAIKDPNTTAAIKATLPEQTTCPVMGGPINKDVFTEYKGQKIYFCCTDCIEMFKKDPEKYIGNIK